MSRARDMANLGAQAGSGLDASDITTGTLGNTVQDNITRLGTVTTGTMNNTIGSSATFPSGHVLQVKSTTKTDSYSTSGSFSDVTGMSVSITPSSTSNKIFIMVGLNWSGADNVYARGNILRDSTVVSISNSLSLSNQVNATLGLGGDTSGQEYKMNHAVFNHLDSPSSTSALTYKLQLGSNGSVLVYLNRPAYNGNDTFVTGGVSSITVMEIAG